jgi:hypothetical protein
MTLRNIALDPVTGGFVFASGALQFVSDGPSIVQAVNCALKTFLGEYFLDDPDNPTVGVPYFQNVLVKNPDAKILDAVFRAVILGVQGVATVVSLNFSYTAATRALAVAWSATTDLGLLVSGSQSVTS